MVSPNTTPPDPAVTGDVSVSDDGSLVAYARTVASAFPDDSWGPKTQVWIMNSDGTNQHLLYDDGRPGGMSGDNPIGVFDRLLLSRAGQGIQLRCSEPSLPVDSGNLVYRAAALFIEAAKLKEGVRIELEKRIPLEAGLGGGSGNAAATLLGLNNLFENRLAPERLQALAVSLGSDVPFFLQEKPALGTGREPRAIEVRTCRIGP